MEQINRGVVIIYPKQPMLDWVNRTVDTSSPVTMEQLRGDSTAILVPDLDSLEEMADYLDPLKPMLFEMELEAWYCDPTTWPQKRTAELFDIWFELEVHSMVWDAVGAPIVREENGEINLTGTWDVVSSPDFDDDYLHMETAPYVTLHQEGTDVRGEFHIGLIQGSLYGYLDEGRVLFSFEAMDEMEPVNGAGTMTSQGERLGLSLLFHFGDEFTFECVLRDRVDSS
jgi:hypothetical protein